MKKKKIDYFEEMRKSKPIASYGLNEFRKRIQKTTYATPYRYAKLCGVSTQAIYDRIKSGSLTTEEREDINGEIKTVVNLKKFPPSKGKQK